MKFDKYVSFLLESKKDEIEKEGKFTEAELAILKDAKLKVIDADKITYGMGKIYPVKNGTITLKVSPAVKGVFFNVLFLEKGEPTIEGLTVLTEKKINVLNKESLEKFIVDGENLVKLIKEM